MIDVIEATLNSILRKTFFIFYNRKWKQKMWTIERPFVRDGAEGILADIYDVAIKLK